MGAARFSFEFSALCSGWNSLAGSPVFPLSSWVLKILLTPTMSLGRAWHSIEKTHWRTIRKRKKSGEKICTRRNTIGQEASAAFNRPRKLSDLKHTQQHVHIQNASQLNWSLANTNAMNESIFIHTLVDI